jgi:hypothetical protein
MKQALCSVLSVFERIGLESQSNETYFSSMKETVFTGLVAKNL